MVTAARRRIHGTGWPGARRADALFPGGDLYAHHVLRVPRQAAGCAVHRPDRGGLPPWGRRLTTDAWGWEIPTGATDDGESPTEAAAREVHEETGSRPG